MPNQIQADHIFVHESEDNSKIKGPEKMEANQGSNIMAAIYQKLEEANAIIHSMDKKSLVYCAIFHGDEFRVRNHAMILVSSKALFKALVRSEKLGAISLNMI